MSSIAIAALLLALPQGSQQSTPQEPASQEARAPQGQPAQRAAAPSVPPSVPDQVPVRRPQREPNLGVDPASSIVPWSATARRVPIEGEEPASLEELTEWVSTGWSASLHGYIRTSYLVGNAASDPGETESFSFDSLRLFIDARAGDWHFHTAVRGERGLDLQPYGQPNSASVQRMPEMWALYDFAESFHFRIGRFRAPLLSSAMMEENGMVLGYRSLQGREWERDRYQPGVQIDGQIGDLRGWFAIQDGEDQIGENLAFTLKGQWDVLGGGTPQQYQGAFGASDEFALTVGGGLHYDFEDDNYSRQLLDARLTHGPFYFGIEAIDMGNGLFKDISASLIASAMVTDELELAVGFEDIPRPTGGDLWRVATTWYIDGRNAKVQASYNTADVRVPGLTGDAFIVGLTIGF
ncbi:MAG: hypothetical protein FJ294_13160 [Planctomycetes bacterium]|nr:hypothetical protein [Planctomycetota bacterium]